MNTSGEEVSVEGRGVVRSSGGTSILEPLQKSINRTKQPIKKHLKMFKLRLDQIRSYRKTHKKELKLTYELKSLCRCSNQSSLDQSKIPLLSVCACAVDTRRFRPRRPFRHCSRSSDTTPPGPRTPGPYSDPRGWAPSASYSGTRCPHRPRS